MHFKLEYTVREFNLQKKDVSQFDVPGIHLVHVQLRAPNEEEQKISHNLQHACCTAQVEVEVSTKNKKVFEKIESNSIIENADEFYQKYKNQKDHEIALPSINEFPEHFRSYLDQINGELSSACRMVINAARWRTNTLGPHNPISTRGLYWSWDKEFWHPAPTSFSLRLLIDSPGVYIPENVEADVKEIIISGTQEPVYHELFREAWGQRADNPRSSLIIGLSALEAAIKTTVSTLIPNTSWLVENIPSPPVSRLLTEYIPKLPAMNTVDGKVLPPPKSIMELIKNAVTIRNKITHIGGKPPDFEMLVQILEAIHDILCLLDYYSGNLWAYNHISENTKQKLKG